MDHHSCWQPHYFDIDFSGDRPLIFHYYSTYQDLNMSNFLSLNASRELTSPSNGQRRGLNAGVEPLNDEKRPNADPPCPYNPSSSL